MNDMVNSSTLIANKDLYRESNYNLSILRYYTIARSNYTMFDIDCAKCGACGGRSTHHPDIITKCQVCGSTPKRSGSVQCDCGCMFWMCDVSGTTVLMSSVYTPTMIHINDDDII